MMSKEEAIKQAKEWLQTAPGKKFAEYVQERVSYTEAQVAENVALLMGMGLLKVLPEEFSDGSNIRLAHPEDISSAIGLNVEDVCKVLKEMRLEP